jgi:glycosyltransferase involved in cell wall biosynthesis
MYNVEPYVERCIRSLENQDIPGDQYEIICINDGSTDNCQKVVENLQKEYKNIILISQENQGVSRARNNGIDKAQGKYIMFIDPDDYVEFNNFGRILKKVRTTKAQVSFLGFTFLNIDETVRTQFFYTEFATEVYVGTEAFYLARGDGQTDPDRMVAVLFEREFLNKYSLRYLSDVPYLEDGEYITRIMCLAKRCIFDGQSFYYRTTRPGSATNSKLFYSERSTNGFLLAAINLKNFQQLAELNDRQRNFLNFPICKFVVLVIASVGKPFNYKRINAARKKLYQAGFRKLSLDSVDREFTLLGFFYNRSVYFLVTYQYFIDLIRYIRIRFKSRQ